jgi:hypothetical protein
MVWPLHRPRSTDHYSHHLLSICCSTSLAIIQNPLSLQHRYPAVLLVAIIFLLGGLYGASEVYQKETQVVEKSWNTLTD